jgi:hypothetical protein
MKNLLLAYDDRTKIPQSLLRMEVKKALDDQWERLNFGAVRLPSLFSPPQPTYCLTLPLTSLSQVVSEVVPYLPLEKKQIEEVSFVISCLPHPSLRSTTDLQTETDQSWAREAWDPMDKSLC